MLLFSCHLVPFFPIYCFEGFVSDSSFLLLALCFLLLCFCLRGLPTPLSLSCVLRASSFSVMQSFALLFFLFFALLSHMTQKNKFSFCRHSFTWCYGVVIFPSAQIHCVYYSFWFQESQTHVQRSAKADGCKNNESNQENSSLRIVQAYFFPLDQFTWDLEVSVPQFRLFSVFIFSPKVDLYTKVTVVLTLILANLPISFFHFCFSIDELSLKRQFWQLEHSLIQLLNQLLIEQLLFGNNCAGVEDTVHHQFCSPFLHSLVGQVPCSQVFSFLWTHHIICHPAFSIFLLILLDLAFLFCIQIYLQTTSNFLPKFTALDQKAQISLAVNTLEYARFFNPIFVLV